MEYWTDIIGEELETIEEPLPADDWSVLQQKYAVVKRRKKAAAFAWAGGITSVAVAIALVLMLVLPDSTSVLPCTTQVISSSTGNLTDLVADQQPPAAFNVVTPSEDVLVAHNQTGDLTDAQSREEIIDVVRDTVSKTESLLADAGSLKKEDKTDATYDSPKGIFGFDDFPVEEPERKRRKISVGISGSASASLIIKKYELHFNPPLDENFSSPGDQTPSDSTGTDSSEPTKVMMKSKASYQDKYRHELPKSFGLSARISLTDRLSINTGLNYTIYASDRTRIFSTHKSSNDRQYAHYLGIPVRLDWMAVGRKYFNFYLGAGVQADKCIYATVGDERLHEKEVLFGLNGAMGIQVNIIPTVGLYFEPDISYSLNEGSIQTYRTREPFVITVRGGLRFNF